MDRRQRLLATSALAVTVLVAYQIFVAPPRPGASTPASAGPATAAPTTGAAASPEPTPAGEPPNPELVPMAMGGGSACQILRDASLACWGYNRGGVLGIGTEYNSSIPQIAQIDGAVRQVSIGFGHACAVLDDATVQCWGQNFDGQLGTPISASPFLEPTAVPGMDRVVSVGAGWGHTCAARDDGTAWCWGRRAPRTQVPGITDAVAVSAGEFHTCLLLRGGFVRCLGTWGSGESGAYDRHDTPTAIKGLENVIALDSGSDFTCGLIADGTVRCFGMNEFGQLGDGTTKVRDAAVPALGIENAVAIGVGPSHSCAAMASGALYCWGLNHDGELGRPPSGYSPQSMPQVVRGIGQATAVDGGWDFTCAIADGEVSCWGANDYGQLGDRTAKGRSRPAPLSRVPDAAIPDADAPTAKIRSDYRFHYKERVKVRFAVPADDGPDGSGIDHIEVRFSRTGGESWEAAKWRPRRWGQWLPVDVPLTMQVRAVDGVGNVGEWVTSPVTAAVRQETATGISYKGPWQTATVPSYFGGATAYTTARGASATFTFTGRSFGLIGRLYRDRGAFQVVVDGQTMGVVDQYSKQKQYKYVVYAQSWAKRGEHTVRIVALGTAGRPRVDIDAFIVIQ